MSPDVSLVVPVYNEGETIAASLAAWMSTLAAAGVTAECVVVDDGSTDATPAALAEAAHTVPAIRVIRQANAGHGAAVARAYREARGQWVLQVDGDDEIGPTYFTALWASRSPEGMALGRREQAGRAAVRRVLSRVAATYVRRAAGTSLHDANVPYRLVPRARLDEFLEVLPTGLVAPNLAMSIFAGVAGWEVREVPVVERRHATARRPLGGVRLWRTAWTALQQSRRFRRHLAGREADHARRS